MMVPTILVIPFIIGLFMILNNNNNKSMMMTTIFVSLMYCFVKVFPPYNAREIYYLFYPLHTTAGIGLSTLKNNISKSTQLKIVNAPKIKSKQIALGNLIPLFLIITSLGGLYHVSIQGMRQQPEYITQEDFEILDYLKNRNLNGTVVTLANPTTRLFKIMGIEEIVFAASASTAPDFSKELQQLYSKETDVEKFNRILLENEVRFLILDSKYTSNITEETMLNKIMFQYSIEKYSRIKIVNIKLEEKNEK